MEFMNKILNKLSKHRNINIFLMANRMNGCMDEWMNEWMNEWMAAIRHQDTNAWRDVKWDEASRVHKKIMNSNREE